MPDEPDQEADDGGTGYTTMSVKQKHLDMMDAAAESLFSTNRVSRSTVLERLISDHPDVNVDTLEPINSNVLDGKEDSTADHEDESGGDHDDEPSDDEPSGDENDSNIILDGYDNGAD